MKLTPRFSDTTAYDFDLAVMKYARMIETRLKETDTVWEKPPKPPGSGQVPVQKPRYSLTELLFERNDGSPDAGDRGADTPDDTLAHLPAALL